MSKDTYIHAYICIIIHICVYTAMHMYTHCIAQCYQGIDRNSEWDWDWVQTYMHIHSHKILHTLRDLHAYTFTDRHCVL